VSLLIIGSVNLLLIGISSADCEIILDLCYFVAVLLGVMVRGRLHTWHQSEALKASEPTRATLAKCLTAYIKNP
jgi:hypothetical protein